MLKTLLTAALLLSTATASTALFATQGQQPTEVRVAALKHEDGRIEFAIQTSDGAGWTERILPTTRFLHPNASPGQWRVSSAVAIGNTSAAVEAEQDAFVGNTVRRDRSGIMTLYTETRERLRDSKLLLETQFGCYEDEFVVLIDVVKDDDLGWRSHGSPTAAHTSTINGRQLPWDWDKRLYFDIDSGYYSGTVGNVLLTEDTQIRVRGDLDVPDFRPDYETHRRIMSASEFVDEITTNVKSRIAFWVYGDPWGKRNHEIVANVNFTEHLAEILHVRETCG